MKYWEFLPFVETRDDFIKFVGLLSLDAENHPEEWSTETTAGFLDRLAIWMADTRRVEQGGPTWKSFAEALAAARVYE